MHKAKQGKKFGRKRDQRAALMRSLARSLILHEKIKTTESKARELRSYIEPIVTKSKNNTLSSKRLVGRNFDSVVVKKLFSDIGPRYKERKGGYTRIVKLLPRKNDAAKTAMIEFV